MRNYITHKEVSALTMVCELAMGRVEDITDGDLKDSFLADIRVVKKLTGELEWKSSTVDDELKWLEEDFEPTSVTHHTNRSK